MLKSTRPFPVSILLTMNAIIVLGKYSPSQNGVVVVDIRGIAPCVAGGGKGHDTDKPKILIEI